MITKMDYELELRRANLERALEMGDPRKIDHARLLLEAAIIRASQPGQVLQGWVGNP